MMMTMPLQRGWQRQLEDGNNAIAMRETTPLRIKGDGVIVTRATTPALWLQGCLSIGNSNNAIVMRATIAIATTTKTPAHWQQQCHHNKGNNTSSTTSNEGIDAILTMVETAEHWQRQRHHCDKSDNRHSNNDKNACALTARTPSQHGQWCQLDNKQQGQQC
jgi:hypothetical protein